MTGIRTCGGYGAAGVLSCMCHGERRHASSSPREHRQPNRADRSDLRQIPDNQEVFLSPNSDTSLVIEVLALVEEGLAGSDLWEAAK